MGGGIRHVRATSQYQAHSIDVKKRFFTFFILVTFFTFFNVFYFFPRFLFSSNVVKEARRGRVFKFHGLTKAYAQLQHLLAIRRSEGQDD